MTGRVLVLAVLLSACGGGGEPPAIVQIDGSSTVYPLTEAVAEEFMLANPRVRVTVGVSGTGGGFSKFVREEIDISDASRPIKAVEAELAAQNDVEYIELPIAFDGLAVITNPESDWVQCLTVEELRLIWEPGSTVNNWNQVRPSFPDHELRLYGAGTDSGTYDYFTAAIVGEEGASRADFTASEDDNVLVQGLAGDQASLGFIPYAYYAENTDKLRLLSIDDGNPDNGNGCIAPNAESVQSGTYQPLARPEFVYVNAERADDPAVLAFTRFYLENAGTLATEVGYVPLSDAAYELGLDRLERRVTGSVFGGEGSSIGVSIEDLLRLKTSTTETPATSGTSASPDAGT